jgi:hypothetical protein
VRAADRFLQTAEDLIKRIPPDLPLAARSQNDIPLGILPDDVVLHQPGEEGIEVDVRIDVSPILQGPHPAHRFIDIAPALQQEVVEQPAQPHLSKKLADEIGVEVGVTVAHGGSGLVISLDQPPHPPSAPSPPLARREGLDFHTALDRESLASLAGRRCRRRVRGCSSTAVTSSATSKSTSQS